jgi:hypothetical protein
MLTTAIIGTLSADFEIVQNLTQQSGATNRLPWAASTLMAVGVATFLAI